MLVYEYPDYGIKISYPAGWEREEFAFDDRHLGSASHPGHLPGLPIQFFQPTELDIRPQDLEIVVLGLYMPLEEDDGHSTSELLVIVEKVGFGYGLDNPLQRHVDSFIEKNIEGRDGSGGDGDGGPATRILETADATLAGSPAKVLVYEKSWTGDDEQQFSYRTMRIFTVKDDRAYSLQYVAPSDRFERHLPEVQQAAGSFQITSTGLGKALAAGAVAAAIGAAALLFVLRARRCRGSLSSLFLANLKMLLPAALGIEILCISAAEIGGNAGLYMFGYNPSGIVLSYMLVYALAGFATFAAILGRQATLGGGSSPLTAAAARCDCCSILESRPGLSFASALKATLASFGRGVRRMGRLHREPGVGGLVKTGLVILVTAESGCILTAATVDFVLYQYSLFVSVPLSLLAGTMAVAAPQALKLARADRRRRLPSMAAAVEAGAHDYGHDHGGARHPDLHSHSGEQEPGRHHNHEHGELAKGGQEGIQKKS